MTVVIVASEPLSVVRTFFEEVGVNGPLAAYERWLAKDCLWQNCGRPDCHGLEDIIALERQAQDALGYERWTAELRASAADGDTVLTDRIDRLVDAEGNVMLDIEVMGSLRVRDGRIIEWREYFDGPAIRERLGL
jgi:limonene-1,2-epoxide hydrolase